MSITNTKITYIKPQTINIHDALLLFLSIAFVCTSSFSLRLLRTETINISLPPLLAISIAIWIAFSILVHFLLNIWTPNRDVLMFPITNLLTGWGLITIWRLQGTYAFRYALWYFISIICMLVIIRWSRNLTFLEKHPYLSLITGIFITGITVLVGVSPSEIGPNLWLPILPVNFINHKIYFQPSELLKVLIILFLAAYLSRKRTTLILENIQNKYALPGAFTIPLITMWSVSTFMVIIQGDLGAGWLIYWCFLVIFYLRTRRKRYALSGIILFLMGVLLAYIYSDLVQFRLHGWIDPWFTDQTHFYQIDQALIAMNKGGIFGTGLGSGIPQYIPLNHSDFIFASIVSEWGHVGGVAIIALLSTLIYRIFRSAQQLPRHSFSALLNTGIGVLFLVQTIINIGGILRILPLTGVPLIFLSYGGSAMLLAHICMAFVFLTRNEKIG